MISVSKYQSCLLKKIFLIILLTFVWSRSGISQTIFEKKVSVQFSNISLGKALLNISSTYGIKFSYANNLIPINTTVSVKMVNKPLKHVLNELFKNTTITYKLVGNQIVLSLVQSQNTNKERIPDPIVIEQKIDSNPIVLITNSDTEKQQIITGDVPMNPYKYDSTQYQRKNKSKHRLSKNKEQQYINKSIQLTVIPGVSTNKKLYEPTANRFSFNLFLGHSAAVKGFELGLLANTQKDYVSGLQIGGLANFSGGNVKALQIGGFMNATNGNVKGVRFSGFANYAKGNVEGLEITGFANMCNHLDGGMQASGFANICRGKLMDDTLLMIKNKPSYQFAGFSNVAIQNIKGIQISGFANVSKRTEGTQIAGFSNVAKDVDGTQISGFVNVAKNVKGSQIGIINICDSIRGVPIGLFSFVKKGYRRVELWGSESFYSNLSLKAGTHVFYNILTFGYQPQKNYYRFGYGYGIGTEFCLRKHLKLNLDLLAYQIGENEIFTNKLNMLGEFKINLAIEPDKHFSVFFGPAYNILVSDYKQADKNIYGSEIGPYSLHTVVSTNINRPVVKMWIGGNIGLQF